MSTNVLPVPNTSGDDSKDIKALIQEALKEHQALQQVQETGGLPQEHLSKPEPIRVTLNGQEREFASSSELQTALQQTLDYYNGQLQQHQAPPPVEKKEGNTTPGFDKERFAKLLDEDIPKAINYANSYAIFGGKVEDPAMVIQQTVAQNLQMQTKLAAYEFRDQNPEMRQYLDSTQQAGSQLLGIMQQLNLPPTTQGFQAAYSQGVMAGVFPAPQQLAQRFQQQAPPPQQRGYNGSAPPLMGGGGGGGEASGLLDEQFLALPEDKRREILASGRIQ